MPHFSVKRFIFLFLLVVALALPSLAQITPLDKDGSLYMVQQNGTASQIYKLDRSTQPYTLTPYTSTVSGSQVLNALGYNRSDGYMYVLGYPVSTTAGLYRIGKAATGAATPGAIQSLGPISGLTSGSFNSGDISSDGFFYFTSSSSVTSTTSTLRRINLNSTPYTATTVTLSQPIYCGDMAFGPNGILYAVGQDGAYMYEISVSSSSSSAGVNRRTLSGAPSGLTIGTTYFDGANGFYGYSNAGNFYSIDIGSGFIQQVSTSPSTSQSDGASVTDTPQMLDVIKSAAALNQINARTFEIPYAIGVKNTGVVTAPNVQLNDNLRLAFSSGTPAIEVVGAPKLSVSSSAGITPTLNQNFNGDTDTKLLAGTDDFAPGASATIAFTLRLTYPTIADVPAATQSNTAYVSSVAGTTYTNPGYTYSSGVAIPPVNALTGEASSPGTTFPSPANSDTPGGTGTTLPPIALSGRVYDDVNYSGGAGRAFDSTKGMAGVTGARVEIYNASGAFVGATTSAGDGTWSFAVSATGTYYARVVNSSVVSSRSSSGGTVLGVQTFRTQNGTAVTNEIGGRVPSATGAPAGSSATTLNTTTFDLSGDISGPAQSVTPIVVTSTTDRSDFDFGFNFDTIVNTNDSGQGSLRQFVLNANALTNTGLAQQGLTAGTETSIFMIPAGALTSGVAKIALASTIQIVGANAGLTSIDGTTQTTNIGDTNAGTFGTGGTVGVDKIALPTLPRPEIEINGPRTVAIGLDIEAASALVKGVAMWGFGASGDSTGFATIGVGQSATGFVGPTITQVLLGASAVAGTGGALVSPNNFGSGDLVRASGVTGGNVSNSIIAFGGGKGIALGGGANGWTIQGNEIHDNSRNSASWDGLDAQVANTQVLENLAYNNGGVGLDSFSASGGATWRNNTSLNNGQLCTPTSGESAGIRVFGTNNTIDRNIVASNYGPAILIQATATARITRNSIYSNGEVTSRSSTTLSGQIGIDLLQSGQDGSHGTSPFVSPNDAGDGDAGGSGLLNFPIITSASIAGGNLTLEGFAPATSTVEVFIAAPDASGFGEGRTYAFSFTEGSSSDTDTTTGAYNAATLQALGYSASVAGLAGSETSANRFRVVVPVGTITSSSLLTATATTANNTSEFSPVLAQSQTSAASILGLVYLDLNADGKRDPGEGGANLSGFFIKIVPQSATSATSAVAVNSDGTYSFPNVSPGTYSLVLDNNDTLADIAPTVPAGFSATESPNGTRAGVVVVSTAIPAQNFGLYAGYSLSGRVFEDNGLGGGTPNDAIQNGSEAGIAGVSLQLKSGATVIANATTGPDGTYSFSVPASYSGQTLSVVEQNATGYVSSGASVGNTGGTYNRSTDTISFPFNTTNGTLTGANFADVRGATLENDGQKVGTRGGSVVYPHVFTANTVGSVSFSVTQLATPATGWSVALYNDLNGNGALDGGEPQILSSSPPIATTASGKINLLIINYVPQNAPDGSQDKITLSATFVPASGGANPSLGTQTLSRGDLTTVGPQSGLSLSKAVDKTTAKSGDLITYTVTYANTGNAPISALVINDSTPAFTTFSSATFSAPLPATLTSCTVAAPSVGNSGAISWTFAGTLAQGASGTVTFVVKVN